jgi:hypothetical protein
VAGWRAPKGEEFSRSQDEDSRHGLAKEAPEVAAIARDEMGGARAERRGEDRSFLLAELEPRREEPFELLGYDAEALNEPLEAQAGLDGFEVPSGLLDDVLRREEICSFDLPKELQA